MRKIVGACALYAAFAIAQTSPAVSYPIDYPKLTADPMRFELITLSDKDLREIGPWQDLVIGNNRNLITGNGKIFGKGQAAGIPATSETLQEFLNAHPVPPGTLLMLGSGGGNLYDSFLAGEVVRKAGLRTSIIPNSACISACNFLFMGGTVRTMPPSTLYIVHRFAPSHTQQVDWKEAVEAAQEQSGFIAMYLREMGVDFDFLVLMSRVPNEKPVIVARHLLEQLHVLTSGATTTWSYGPFSLTATTTQIDNVGPADQLGLICDGGKLKLHVVYFPKGSDYLRPLGVPTEDPDQTAFLQKLGIIEDNTPYVKMIREELERYAPWDGGTSRLIAMTYAFKVENFPLAVVTPLSASLGFSEGQDHSSVDVLLDMTDELRDFLLSSNGVAFGFMISKDRQPPANYEISQRKHKEDSSVAAVSFFTRIDDEARGKIRTFVAGCTMTHPTTIARLVGRSVFSGMA